MKILKSWPRTAAALVCFGIAALLAAQTGTGTRTKSASRPTSAPPTAAGPTADTVKYRALVDKYCVSCHNARTANPAEGPVNLEGAAFDDLLGHAGTHA